MGIRVGIDLGTTFSAVARIDPYTGKPTVIKNVFGSATTPSVLYFEKDGTILYGEDAKNMQSVGDSNVIAFFKRNMGKETSLEFFGRVYTPTDLSAILLKKLKEEAERQTGEEVDAAVITVPAYFTHKEREATIEAGKKAGLEVIAIINEPTAAAFAYGMNEKREEQTILIYDLGGGTFDVTVAQINKNEIRTLGSDGHHELGGKDWDDCIVRYLVNEFLEKYDTDLSEDGEMMSSLLVTAEKVKKQLSSMDEVSIPIAYRGTRGTVEITEEIFESVSQSLLLITQDITERLMDSLELSWAQIDGVILVGGSTRMRMIHNYVYEMSGKSPLGGVNVDEAVALGAAIRANINEKGESISTMGASSGKTGSKKLLVQGAKAVTDVTAHSLGMISISSNGEEYVNSVIIRKNTKIPVSNTRPFHLKTHAKNNTLEVYVLQGERKRPLDNTVINKYVISEIEHVTSAEAVIDITYEYTSNGVIEVSATQKGIDKKLPITIRPVPEDMSWTDRSPKDNVSNVEVLLAVDLSGSMCGVPTEKACEAMRDFVMKMDSDYTKIGVMAFADESSLQESPTKDFNAVIAAINGLSCGMVGFGNDAEPFSLAYNLLSEEKRKGGCRETGVADITEARSPRLEDSDPLLSGQSRPGLSNHEKETENSIKYLVVLTDGVWVDPDSAIRRAKKCHAAGIEVLALGFGNADYSFLKQIASTDKFASITDLANLGESFANIAQAIGEGATGLSVL